MTARTREIQTDRKDREEGKKKKENRTVTTQQSRYKRKPLHLRQLAPLKKKKEWKKL